MSDIQSQLTVPEVSQTKFYSNLAQQKRGWKRCLLMIWAMMGPGLVAALADNDAGGVISYTVTGAQFGIGLFIPLVLPLAPLTFTIQEMSMRLSSMICLLLISSFVIFTGYWTKERFALLVGALNAIFLVIAAMTHPSMSAIGHAFADWNVPQGQNGGLIWYVIATIGNAIAPWMIFFQGSGVIDKGVTSHELRLSRMDTAIGCVIQVVIAAGIVICGATLVGHMQDVGSAGPSDLINALGSIAGRWPAILFGLGLFNAGFLASITISLSSSWRGV